MVRCALIRVSITLKASSEELFQLEQFPSYRVDGLSS